MRAGLKALLFGVACNLVILIVFVIFYNYGPPLRPSIGHTIAAWALILVSLGWFVAECCKGGGDPLR